MAHSNLANSPVGFKTSRSFTSLALGMTLSAAFALEGSERSLAQALRKTVRLAREVHAFSAEAIASLCRPLIGELACACSSLEQDTGRRAPEGDVPVIEGWLAFPTAITDGTATGTVFLETNPEEGARCRVIANLSLNRSGKQNWLYFRMSLSGELELEGSYGLRATVVATDAVTGHKRLFGTTRASPLFRKRPAAGIILELEDWG